GLLFRTGAGAGAARLVHSLVGRASPLLLQEIRVGSKTPAAGHGIKFRPGRAVVATRFLPAGARPGGTGQSLLPKRAGIQHAQPGSGRGAAEALSGRILGEAPRPLAPTVSRMNALWLDKLLDAANEFGASDLHLIAG